MSSGPAAAGSGAGVPGSAALSSHPLLDRIMRRRRRVREFDRRRPRVLDAAVMGFVALVVASDLLFNDGSPPYQPGAGVRGTFPVLVPFGFSVVMIAALWWRRTRPAAVFLFLSTIVVVQSAIGLWLPARVSVLIALYTLASMGSLRLFRWAAVVIGAETVLIVLVLEEVDRPLLSLFFILGTVTAAAALGLTVRIRRQYTEALEDRARRLEVERDQRERLIASAERARIAREMHDILGHNLSVMVTLADGAATLADKRSEESAGTLRMLGDTGREAMGELRRVLGVLRADGRDPRSLSPQPGIENLDLLLERVRAAGLTVTCRTSGRLDLLSPGVQLTVYRIIQEALTNTLKHAGSPAAAAVALSVDDSSIHIRVMDTGGAGPAGGGRRESGRGLIGIRERAALYGGTAAIGPRESGGGWIVDVVLERTAVPHGVGDEPAAASDVVAEP